MDVKQPSGARPARSLRREQVVEEFSRAEFRAVLESQIIPHVVAGSATLVPAHPTLAARVARVLPHVAPLLRNTQRSRATSVAAHWVEEGLNSARFPTLIWVAEGEADFRLGVTSRMVVEDKTLSRRHGYYTLTLQANSILILPPGMPISDASRPHWERPHIQDARSRLLWFHIYPPGVTLHACTTRGEEHTSSYSLFLNEPSLLALSESVIEELTNKRLHGQELARHKLAACLFHIDRALRSTQPGDGTSTMPSAVHISSGYESPVTRACRYIQSRLSQRLTVSQIAAHAYVSQAQLNRLFHAELNMTPAQYILKLRMEQARTLLENSEISVQRIGALCGYPQPAHFGRAFRQAMRMTPTAYRKQNQAAQMKSPSAHPVP